ncbi:TlpA family protein disulfide reductase [Microbacterium rhizomatis]|uniref:TlpA family protein disulfide reductase n=1 Tax=Microbacterium rhizomatis TaxID=1631477 RepID=A0A5J5J8I8_9MICO|nr:TlpA disulfide reductase family protein [Microbacterium rhizomatis]KAA9111484.1 TlpA family protein disulfide reductase [Microbacterium rhizomatis]
MPSSGPRTARQRRRWRAASAILAIGLVVGLSACANDPLAEQYKAGDNKGFIAANGFQVKEIASADRGAPVVFQGKTESGVVVASDDYAGDVLVVNFWYAACGPCRAEAPQLEKAYAAFTGKPVSFLGVNTSDSPETAAAFASDYGITYPSLIAATDGAIKLAFADATSLNATPTTLVIDKQGRVAARVIGQLEDASILQTLVQDALDAQ